MHSPIFTFYFHVLVCHPPPPPKSRLLPQQTGLGNACLLSSPLTSSQTHVAGILTKLVLPQSRSLRHPNVLRHHNLSRRPADETHKCFSKHGTDFGDLWCMNWRAGLTKFYPYISAVLLELHKVKKQKN